MVESTQPTNGLTPKGHRTRTRIVAAAARLIHENGVGGTTVDDVKAAAEVSSSQLYHYFADKDALLEAVVDHQADVVVHTQRHADFSTVEGRLAWRDMVLAEARRAAGQGGCPLGALGGQLAETDPAARTRVAAGFARWTDAIRDQLHTLHTRGQLPPGIDPEELAVTVLATLQGGLLLAQVGRDTRPLQLALDTLLALVAAGSTRPAQAAVLPESPSA